MNKSSLRYSNLSHLILRIVTGLMMIFGHGWLTLVLMGGGKYVTNGTEMFQ